MTKFGSMGFRDQDLTFNMPGGGTYTYPRVREDKGRIWRILEMTPTHDDAVDEARTWKMNSDDPKEKFRVWGRVVYKEITPEELDRLKTQEEAFASDDPEVIAEHFESLDDFTKYARRQLGEI